MLCKNCNIECHVCSHLKTQKKCVFCIFRALILVLLIFKLLVYHYLTQYNNLRNAENV